MFVIVDGYTLEPGPKLCIVSKLEKFVKGFENSALGHIFCLAFATHEGQRLSIKRALGRPHQLTKGVRIAVEDEADHCGLG